MTGEDHDNDAVIAALTSPALPSEHVGEAAAVTAMLDALPTTPARSAERRPRRGIAIAAVTVASLGVGGLVAAGPGAFFFPAADRSPATFPDTTIDSSAPLSTLESDPDNRNPGSDTTAASSTTVLDTTVDTTPSPTFGAPVVPGDEIGPGDADECDGTHGEAVSDIARSTVLGNEVSDAARSDCGKPDQTDRPSPSDTAPGQTGDTPSDTAPGQTGDTPSNTAPRKPDTAPRKPDTAPAQPDTAPAQPDTAPAQPDTAPAQPDDSPSDTAPGQAGARDRGSSDTARP